MAFGRAAGLVRALFLTAGTSPAARHPTASLPRFRIGFLRLTLTFVAVSWCVPTRVAEAQNVTPATPDVRPFHDFVISTVEGKELPGPLRKIDSYGNVRIGGMQPEVIDADRVISIRRARPAFPDNNYLVLANGDVVRLAANGRVTLSDDLLQVEAETLRRKNGLVLRVPVTFAALLWFEAPANSDDDALLRQRLQQAKRSEDLVLLRNGDHIEGSISAIDAENGCVVSARARKSKTPLAQVAAIAFNSELRAHVQPRKLYGQLVLEDGSRLGMSSLELAVDSERIVGKTFFGEQVEAPVAKVAGIDYRLGAAVYLSELEPKKYEHTPFLGVTQPLARDVNVCGTPLQISKLTYDKGLGMRPAAQATWSLDRRYRWFEANVGIDSSSRFGAARMRVVVDGKEAWHKEVAGRQEPIVLRIDVRQASEITLVADFADFGAVQAYVDWGEARLIKSR